jgi:hypothetical protein
VKALGRGRGGVKGKELWEFDDLNGFNVGKHGKTMS